MTTRYTEKYSPVIKDFSAQEKELFHNGYRAIKQGNDWKVHSSNLNSKQKFIRFLYGIRIVKYKGFLFFQIVCTLCPTSKIKMTHCLFKRLVCKSLYQKPVILTEAVVWKRSVKKVFLKISKNSQENNCVGVFFKIKLQAWEGLRYRCFPMNFAKFSRTPPSMAASFSKYFPKGECL